MKRRASPIAVVVLGLLAVLATGDAQAREVDQFTDRLFQLDHLADAGATLDAHVDAQLAALVAALDAARPASEDARDRIIHDAFQGSSIELVAQIRTPFEEWARIEAPVELFAVTGRGMYGGDVDYDDMGMAWYINNAPVIRVGAVLAGVDKLGHFLGQGWFYYREYHRLRAADPRATDDELRRRLRKYGHDLEISYLGLAGTGVYSYADLAANWSGFQFYLDLFTGPAPFITIAADGSYHRGRTFHIADYATDAWDEVANPSRPRSDRFYGKVARYLRANVCADYRRDPARFTNATPRTQTPTDYVWDGATEATFTCKRRFAIADVCR